MSLTRDAWEKLILLVIGAVLGAILSPFGQFLWWQWRDPDVRYATGGAYIHPKLAIATMGLKNWGGSDAENVLITASFADPFTDVSTDQITTSFEPSGGAATKSLSRGPSKDSQPVRQLTSISSQNLLHHGLIRSP